YSTLFRSAAVLVSPGFIGLRGGALGRDCLALDADGSVRGEAGTGELESVLLEILERDLLRLQLDGGVDLGVVDDGDGAVEGLGLGAFAVDGDFEGDLARLEAVGVALPPDVEDVVTVGFGGLGLSGQGVLDAVALLDSRDGDVDALV